MRKCALNGLRRKRHELKSTVIYERLRSTKSVIIFPFSLLYLKEGRLSTSLSTRTLLGYHVDLGFHFQALRGMASENDGHVTCPKTKEIFRVDQADKVYVM